ncbi:MAG: glutamate-5-semialdehyde dehydrogenase [bacterium]|nr:glutamate-5-semialdehyde dehydrogenase [bacterium]
MTDIETSLASTKDASRALASVPDDKINSTLLALADALVENTNDILEENAKDLARMDKEDPKYDRLLLDAERISSIASDIRNVVTLQSPIGKELVTRTLDNGLELSKITTPIGVIGIIYEARPNVTVDAFALCFKSRNAVALKGGSDAEFSNKKLVDCIHTVLKESGISKNVIYLLPPDREAVKELLHAQDYVDLVIPRGSQALINFVRAEATVPTIETGAGIVHVYVDSSADVQKATDIIDNAKTRRPSVCNAADTVIIHKDLLTSLPAICSPLAAKSVEIFADAKSLAVLTGSYPAELLSLATEDHFGTEFLSLKLSIKTVDSLDEALQHIAKYSSGHSESIVAEDSAAIDTYLQQVDAAAVYANASTSFTDGAQFGLGAEIGISTQKLHARGPMGLEELTSYKWVIRGDGQIR